MPQADHSWEFSRDHSSRDFSQGAIQVVYIARRRPAGPVEEATFTVATFGSPPSRDTRENQVNSSGGSELGVAIYCGMGILPMDAVLSILAGTPAKSARAQRSGTQRTR